MNETQLPPRPDRARTGHYEAVAVEVPTKQRRKVWPWVVGVIIVLGAVGALTDQNGSSTTTTTPDPITSSDSGLTLDEAYTQAVPILAQVTTELEYITATSDISADIGHLNHAADLMDDAAALFVGVSEAQVLYLSNAGDHFRAAAVAEGAGDGTTFGDEMDAATADLHSALAAVQNTSYSGGVTI